MAGFNRNSVPLDTLVSPETAGEAQVYVSIAGRPELCQLKDLTKEQLISVLAGQLLYFEHLEAQADILQQSAAALFQPGIPQAVAHELQRTDD